jgi:hypothetical protein
MPKLAAGITGRPPSRTKWHCHLSSPAPPHRGEGFFSTSSCGNIQIFGQQNLSQRDWTPGTLAKGAPTLAGEKGHSLYSFRYLINRSFRMFETQWEHQTKFKGKLKF